MSQSHPYVPRSGSLAGHSFTSERGYRNALARTHGYPSWSAQQRAPRIVTRMHDLAGLHPSERLARDQALEALSLMRTDGLSLQEAADRANTTPNAVIRHAGPALRRSAAGRYETTRADRLFRPVRILSTAGEVDADLRGSRVASLVSAHHIAVGHFLATGDTTVLAPFVGKKVHGHELETRPEVLEERARRGELSFEDLYRE